MFLLLACLRICCLCLGVCLLSLGILLFVVCCDLFGFTLAFGVGWLLGCANRLALGLWFWGFYFWLCLLLGDLVVVN